LVEEQKCLPEEDARKTMTAETTFHFPPDMLYDCLRCGACCTGSWEIRADAEAKERIAASDWRALSNLPPRASTPFKRSPSQIGATCLARTSDGACGFLDADHLCRLQKAHGYAFKARICQAFPFRPVRTPGGLYVGLSFACDSVLAQSGQPVADHAEELRDLIEREPDACVSVEEPVRFDARTPIAWSDYLALEAGLDAILAQEHRPLAECLRAGHVWLGMLRQLIAKARLADPHILSALIARYAEDGRATAYERAFRIARRHVPHATLKRMLIGTFIAFRNGLRPHQWRLWAMARVMGGLLRHWTRVGTLRFRPLDVRLPYREFCTRADDLTDPEAESLLRRYARHAMFRKDMILATDLFWGYSYLVLVYGLVQWHEAALRAAGRPDPAVALATVECDFVHHTSFNQTFLYHPAMADIIRRYFNKPNFAHLVTQD
jgi:Fe-S-cluster containining protein